MAFSIRLRTARRISLGRHETGTAACGVPGHGLLHLLKVRADAFDESGEIDLATFLPAGASCGRQHCFGQGLEFFEIFLDPLPHFVIGDEFGADAHRRDRRAQIVADGRKKLPLALQGSRDLVGHRIEGNGGTAHIVRALFGHAGRVAAARDFAGGVGQLRQGARDAPGDKSGNRRSGQNGDQCRQEELQRPGFWPRQKDCRHKLGAAHDGKRDLDDAGNAAPVVRMAASYIGARTWRQAGAR